MSVDSRKITKGQRAISVILWLQLFDLGSTFIHIPQSIEAFGLIVTTGIFLLIVPKKLNYHFLSYASVFLVSTISLEFISSVMSQTPVATQRYAIAFIVFGVSLVMGTQSFEEMIDGFRIAASVILGISFILNLTGQEVFDLPSSFSWNLLRIRGSGMLAHPNALGLLATLVLLTTTGLFHTSLRKSFLRMVQLFSIVTLVTTEYRGGMLSCAAIIGADWILLGFRQKKYLRVLILILCGIGVGLFSGILSTSRSSNVDLTTGRTGIWNQCLTLIQNQPFLGNGPLTMERFYGGLTSSTISAYHCHNQFLDHWVNFGKLGLLEMLIFFILLCFAAFKSRNSLAIKLSFGLVIISLFESPFRYWSPEDLQWQNVFIVAAFLSIAKPLKRSASKVANYLVKTSY